MKPLIYTFVSAFLFCVAESAVAGQVTEQAYDISDVQELYAGSGLSLKVVQGNTESLSVKASPEMMKRVHVDLTNHKLSLSINNSIGNAFSWFDKNEVTFVVTIKNLQQVELSGGVEAKIGKLDIEKLIVKSSGGSEAQFANLQVKDIFLDVSGGSSINVGIVKSEKINVHLSGGSEFKVTENSVTNLLTIDAGGGSEYQAKKLISKTANVHAGGAAEIDLAVDETLKVNAGGASNVNYHGKPRVLSEIGGASELTSNN